MAIRTTKAKATPVFLVSRNWQLAFVTMIVLSWAANVATMFIWASSGYTSSGTWAYQITQSGVPLLWFAAALWFVWSKYRTHLHRFFAASLTTVVGYGLFQVFCNVENTLRFRFFPPVIEDPSDNSLLTAFGHEWLVMGIGFVLFIGLLLCKRYVRKGK